ncbi:hypothetical protein BB560_001885, partial [Smittium megazygosporum]
MISNRSSLIKGFLYFSTIFLLWFAIPLFLRIPPWAPQLGGLESHTSGDYRSPWKSPRNLTLHILPHSHCDLGWNLSFDEYYAQSIKTVIENVLIELYKNPKRRFSWNDIPYIEKFLKEEGNKPNMLLENSSDKALTWNQLADIVVNKKQLEFGNLEYSSPDELLTDLRSQFENMDVGRSYLAARFNSTTSTVLHIDNFGHKHTTPFILSKNGVDKMILGRMSFSSESDFKSTGGFQFLYGSRFGNSQLLTHYLSIHYGFPAREFDFDRRPDCNPKALLSALNSFAISQVGLYPSHGHILIMMGDDFRFTKAKHAFDCLDRVINLANSKKNKSFGNGPNKIQVKYSSPSEYMNTVSAYFEEDPNLKQKLRKVSFDFAPYNDIPLESYWTGIYSTRPALKSYIRKVARIIKQAQAFLAMSKLEFRRSQSTASTFIDSETDIRVSADIIDAENFLEEAQKQLAFCHHHDGITGTCTPSTFLDYVKRLDLAFNKASASLLISSKILQLSYSNNIQLYSSTKMIDQVYEADSHEDELEGEQGFSKSHFHVPFSVCNSHLCRNVTLIVSNMANPTLGSKPITLYLETNMIDIIELDSKKPVDFQIEYVLDDMQFSDNTFSVAEDISLKNRDTERSHIKTSERVLNESASPKPRYYKVVFLADKIPAIGFKKYQIIHSGSSKKQNVIHSFLNVEKQSVQLKIGNNNLNVLSIQKVQNQNGKILLKLGNNSVLYEQRQYIVSKFRGSGAYLFHSNIQMYALMYVYIVASLLLGYFLNGYIFSSGPNKKRGSIFSYLEGGIPSKDIHYFVKSNNNSYSYSSSNTTNAKSGIFPRYFILISVGISILVIGAFLGTMLVLTLVQYLPENVLKSWTNSQNLIPLFVIFISVGYLIKSTLPIAILKMDRSLKYALQRLFLPSQLKRAFPSESRVAALLLYGFLFGLYWGQIAYPEHHSRVLNPISYHCKVSLGNTTSSATLYYSGSKTTFYVYNIKNNDLNDPVVKVVTSAVGKKNIESVVRFSQLKKEEQGLIDKISWFFRPIFGSFDSFFIDENPTPLSYKFWTVIPGNYFPILHRISTSHFGIQVKQAMGGTNIAKGALEFLIHRSFLQNDKRGLWGNLVDNSKVGISHYIDFNGDPKTPYSHANNKFKADQAVHVAGYYSSIGSKTIADNGIKGLAESNSWSVFGTQYLKSIGTREMVKIDKDAHGIEIIGMVSRDTPFPTRNQIANSSFDKKKSNEVHLYIRLFSYSHGQQIKSIHRAKKYFLNKFFHGSSNVKVEVFEVVNDYGFVDDSFVYRNDNDELQKPRDLQRISSKQ